MMHSGIAATMKLLDTIRDHCEKPEEKSLRSCFINWITETGLWIIVLDSSMILFTPAAWTNRPQASNFLSHLFSIIKTTDSPHFSERLSILRRGGVTLQPSDLGFSTGRVGGERSEASFPVQEEAVASWQLSLIWLAKAKTYSQLQDFCLQTGHWRYFGDDSVMSPGLASCELRGWKRNGSSKIILCSDRLSGY